MMTRRFFSEFNADAIRTVCFVLDNDNSCLYDSTMQNKYLFEPRSYLVESFVTMTNLTAVQNEYFDAVLLDISCLEY